MLLDKRIRPYDLSNIEIKDFNESDFKKNDAETHFLLKDNLVFVYDRDYELMFVSYSVIRAIKSLQWCNKEYENYFRKEVSLC